MSKSTADHVVHDGQAQVTSDSDSSTYPSESGHHFSTAIPLRRSSVPLPQIQSKSDQSSSKSIASTSIRKCTSDQHLSSCDECPGKRAEIPLREAPGPSANGKLHHTSHGSSGETQVDPVARSSTAFDEGDGTSPHDNSVLAGSSEGTHVEDDEAAFKAALQLYSAYIANVTQKDAQFPRPAYVVNPSTSGQAHGAGHRQTLSSNETCVEGTTGSPKPPTQSIHPMTDESSPPAAQELCDKCRKWLAKEQSANVANPSKSVHAHGTGHRPTLSSNETYGKGGVGFSEASKLTTRSTRPVTDRSRPVDPGHCANCRNVTIKRDASKVITQGITPVAFAPNVPSINELNQAYQRRGTTVVDEHRAQLPGSHSHNNAPATTPGTDEACNAGSGTSLLCRVLSMFRRSPAQQETRRRPGFRVSEARLPPPETVYPYPETARQRFHLFRRHAMP